MKNQLVEHAKYELKRAGLFEKNSDYGGMLGRSIMRLIKAFSKEGYSRAGANIQIEIFSKLASFKPLSPLTNSPDEWIEIETGIWQSKRSSDCFSTDGGKTYYSVNDKNKQIKIAKEGKIIRRR